MFIFRLDTHIDVFGQFIISAVGNWNELKAEKSQWNYVAVVHLLHFQFRTQNGGTWFLLLTVYKCLLTVCPSFQSLYSQCGWWRL